VLNKFASTATLAESGVVGWFWITKPGSYLRRHEVNRLLVI
jgi:hypothetical protein